MKKFKMYEAIVDDGKNVFKVTGMHSSKREMSAAIAGNGEIVKAKDVTEDTPLDENKVYDALISGGFGEIEARAISRFVGDNYMNAI